MRIFPLLLIPFFLSACQTTTTLQPQATIGAMPASQITQTCKDPNIEYIGRFEKRGDSCTFSYPGSEIRMKVNGTRLVMHFEQINQAEYDAYADVRIDGRWASTMSLKGNQWHTVFTSKTPETHEISIVKRNEPWMGEVRFTGINLKGTLLSPAPAEKFSLLFIGSSYEAGFGNLGDYALGETKPDYFTQEGMNHYFAYPAIVARDVNAQHTCVCFGGKGLMRAYDGETKNQLPELFHKDLALGSTETDLNNEHPDIIFIHLGGNDFVLGAPEKDAFISAYKKQVYTIRKAFPNTPIVMSFINLSPKDGNMASQTFPEHVAFLKSKNEKNKVRLTYLKEIKQQLEDEQLKQLYLWDYEDMDVARWGEALHPNVITHRNIAKSLEKFISKHHLLYAS